MRRVKIGFFGILFLAVVGLGLWAWWNFDLRWRPHNITRHQPEIGKILETSGWVSPKLAGPKLYMLSYRSCADCIRFEKEEFPKLQAAGVDTRVIMIARADLNGAAKSTAPERATVAELWANRDWKLYQRWMAANPPEAWTAAGVAPADGDATRTAVVELGRTLVTNLKPLLKDNGVKSAYPTLIWWTKGGAMHACTCENPGSYANVEKELGV